MERPEGPQSPAPGPESPPGGPQPQSYTGPVPPGGWQQPLPPVVPGGQLAGWGARAGAYIIDGLVLLVPVAIVGALVVGAVAGFDDDDDVAIGAVILASLLFILIFAIAALLYAPLLMMRQGQHNGQTWGKQVAGIRAVRDNGQPFDFGSAALREVVLKGLAVGIASSIIPFLPWFLNFFWPLWDDENRALHDMAASTHVVRA